jgi:primosomal protein N' (replication factor Y)
MKAPPPDEADATSSSIVADVLVPVAVDTAYSYRVPTDLRLELGQFVAMPLGTRIATGVVWATRAGGGDNLKSIVEVRDWPPLRQPLRDFVDWVARWTLAPRGSVLRMAVRAPDATAAPMPKWGLRKTGKPPDRLTNARTRVLAALEAASPMAKTALAAMAGCGTGVIDGLVDDGALEAVELPP